MAFCTTGFPPRCPVLAQGAITFFGEFIGGEKSNFHVLSVQDLSNQRRHTHVARVKRQVQGLITKRSCMGASNAQKEQEAKAQATHRFQYRFA
jgi:hypothetical protein